MSVLGTTMNMGDRTDRDFDAMRARLIALVQSVFPDWTDFDVASFGNVLLELFCFVGDVLGFYQDALARESRLSTATQRKNVMALARMLGYAMRGAAAATAEVTLTLSAPPVAAVTIPAGTVVRTQEVTAPVRFELLNDAVFSAGQDPPSVTVTAEHSASHAALVEASSSGAGQAHFEHVLERIPYLDGSLRARTASVDYTEVTSFLDAGPNDACFRVLVDEAGRATVRFGDGRSGRIPTGTLTLTYKTGGGVEGNVDAERLVLIEGRFADAFGNPVHVHITNRAPASGGSKRESLASAKLRAPESLRALTRSVAREDFEIHARGVPGVARALMLTSNEDVRVAENTGVLHVLPEPGASGSASANAPMPTPALKNRVLRQVTEVYPCTLTFQVRVLDPVYKRIDVSARLFVDGSASPSEVSSRVRMRLSDFFRVSLPDGTPNPQVDFGLRRGEIAWSDVFNIVRDTPGVRKLGDGASDLTLNGLPADVTLRAEAFPVLGAVTLINGTTGTTDGTGGWL